MTEKRLPRGTAPAELFDALADEYETMREELGWDPFPHIYEVFGESQSLQGRHILDIGCGTGEVARYLTDRGASVVGFDTSERMIAYAVAQVPEATFIVGDLNEPLPFEDDEFDAVIALGCMEYAVCIPETCREMCRVSQEGGDVLWAVELCGPDCDGGKAERIEFLGEWIRHRLSRESLQSLIESLPLNARFDVVRGFLLEEIGDWTRYGRVIGRKT